ncbi:hypothetical protein OPV22_006966 [Ensete ventricosum]|uniref:HMA domain-containing protein n=1 Tax=Ensete ventricosum TaxID=4639 RepID=A0AAV8RG75_ENSVE|nr:hypothetical protein OPV22_006966 [Ensete ventricosum]
MLPNHLPFVFTRSFRRKMRRTSHQCIITDSTIGEAKQEVEAEQEEKKEEKQEKKKKRGSKTVTSSSHRPVGGLAPCWMCEEDREVHTQTQNALQFDVESVEVDMTQNQVTVKGTVNPRTLCSRISKTTMRRAAVLSPLPPAEGDSKPEAVPFQICYYNLNMVSPNGASGRHRLERRQGHLTGTMNGEKPVEYIRRRTGKVASIVPQPPKEEQRKKKQKRNPRRRPQKGRKRKSRRRRKRRKRNHPNHRFLQAATRTETVRKRREATRSRRQRAGERPLPPESAKQT